MFSRLLRDNYWVKLMQIRRLWEYVRPTLLVAFVFGVVFGTGQVMAQTSNSPNYQMTETEFGAGSSQESCSAEYCATATIGELGNSSSATSAEFGEVSYSEPMLEMIVASGDSNLGVLTTERTATQLMLVKVRSHNSGGYILQIIGDPPKFDGHTLDTPQNPIASRPGVEQFGINAVANSNPGVGADPVQVPADSVVFGEIASNYATADMFMYKSGDIVAQSEQNSGGTDYTITMIINISNSTPSGHYTGDFSAVLIPAF